MSGDASSDPSAHARIVAVGDELLAGAHPDTNSPEVAERLAALGIGVDGVEVVGDDELEIAAAVGRAAGRARLVVVTGGLGPTLDDVTRHGIARALGRGLEENADAVRELERWHERRGTAMPVANLRQALFPAGAELVPNRAGTAPGFWVELEPGAPGTAVVVSLPGPPAEMHIVWAEEVEPRLVARGLGAEPLAEHRFHLFGLSESVFADAVGPWMEREASPRMGCSVKKGVLSVVLRARTDGGTESDARTALVERVAAFRARFAEYLFSEDDPRVEHVLGRALIESGTTVTLAESCTGGLAASLLCRVPGISAVFGRSFVTYANEAKSEVLGVAPELLARHGSVSREVAEAMALGAARAAGARLALAVTGIAGPDGASEEKPLGLVWVATALDGEPESRRLRLPPGARDWIRTLSARHALFAGLQRLRADR